MTINLIGVWRHHPEPCEIMIDVGTTEAVISAHRLRDEGRVFLACGKPVRYRSWNRGYEYRCKAGHAWVTPTP